MLDSKAIAQRLSFCNKMKEWGKSKISPYRRTGQCGYVSGADVPKSQQKPTVIITGASSGLGLAAAKALADAGQWHVVMVSGRAPLTPDWPCWVDVCRTGSAHLNGGFPPSWDLGIDEQPPDPQCPTLSDVGRNSAQAVSAARTLLDLV